MPSIEKHVKASLEKTGKDYREIHVWLDGEPEKKLKGTTSQRSMNTVKRSKKNMEKKPFRSISSISTMI